VLRCIRMIQCDAFFLVCPCAFSPRTSSVGKARTQFCHGHRHSRVSGNLKYPSFRGSGAAREPGTQNTDLCSLGMAGVHRLRAWSYGPSRNDEEVSARQRH
jgi:hypothetical protein